MPSSSLGCRCISQADGPKESRVLAHVDGDVSVHHLHGDLLPGFEQAHPGRVAGVEVGLAGLDAPSALQKGLLVHHHLVAGEIGEVDVVDLMWGREKKGVRDGIGVWGASAASWGCVQPLLAPTPALTGDLCEAGRAPSPPGTSFIPLQIDPSMQNPLNPCA